MKANALIILAVISAVTSLEICPYTPIKKVIRTAIRNFDSAAKQTVAIQHLMEEMVEASWGVVVVEDPELIGSEVHWTVPNAWQVEGKEAFCVTVINGWQYNVFLVHNKKLRQEKSPSIDRYSSAVHINQTRSSEFSYV
uniref:Uncharacterized protein n=1 Tax=Plectus sambesii TaxID=2011161 RepID=A0A914VWG4_9BILA